MNRFVRFVLLLTLIATVTAEDLTCDVCVVGCGSSGFGAALAAARTGAQVIVLEKQDIVGGTGTAGMVCSWGGGPGDSTARELYKRLEPRNGACVSTFTGKLPYHCIVPNKKKTYADTLRRYPGGNRNKVNVTYEPMAMAVVMRELLEEHGVRVLLETTFTEAETRGKRVTRITAERGDETLRIGAKVFVDATGDVYLCRAAGCETVIGEELNGITLCYRVKRGGEEDPAVLKAKPLKRISSNHELPGGDRMLNMLPTVPGTYIRQHGYEKTMAKCRQLIRRHWAFMRQQPGGWKAYRFAEEARMLGIREGYRIVGEYTMELGDLTKGYYDQPHDDMITLAEHPVDFHGGHKGKRPRVKPYGIPYRCMIPRGWKNILVPCRGAGFDRIAASSARLQRTMLWMGHAAGLGAAHAAARDVAVGDVDVAEIVAAVGMTRADVDRMLGKQPARSEEKPTAAVIGEVRHPFLCSDNGLGRILRFDAEGELVWEYPAPRCQDVWQLANGNVLFTTYAGGRGAVREVTPDKEVVFEVEVEGEVHGCQRLADGTTLVGICGEKRAVVFDAEGQRQREIPLTTAQKNAHYHLRQLRMTPQDTLLVAHPKDGVVREYDLAGTVQRTFEGAGEPFAAVRLANGHTLISGGGAATVTEFDGEGKVVWRLTAKDVPAVNLKWAAGAQRLADGTTVVCNWLGHGQAGTGAPLFAVNRDKQLVWRFTDTAATRSISSVCVLTPDEVVDGAR